MPSGVDHEAVREWFERVRDEAIRVEKLALEMGREVNTQPGEDRRMTFDVPEAVNVMSIAQRLREIANRGLKEDG